MQACAPTTFLGCSGLSKFFFCSLHKLDHEGTFASFWLTKSIFLSFTNVILQWYGYTVYGICIFLLTQMMMNHLMINLQMDISLMIVQKMTSSHDESFDNDQQFRNNDLSHDSPGSNHDNIYDDKEYFTSGRG